MTEMLHGMEDHGKESAAQDSFHASDNTTNATNATVKIEDKTLDPQSSEYNAAINKASVSAAAQLQDLTDRALRFLSHASNETLGACLIGLSATTYLVLGRVGLVLIGVVGGIALHATWEASGNSHGEGSMAKEKEANKRKELGLEVTQRVFAWREERNAEADEPTASPTQLVKPSTDKKLDFSGFQPETAAALNAFTDAIIRDYVKWWYAPVLPGEDSFPLACRQTLAAFLLSLSSHLSRKRPVDAFLDFVTNSSSIVIVFLNELSAALNASPNSTAPDAVATYLELKPECSLAHILHKGHQEKKLNMVATDILQNYVDPKAYACPPVQAFLKQILSKLVLSMTIDTCSKPEWINGWIVYLLEDGEPALLDAIDAGVDAGVENSVETGSKPLREEAIMAISPTAPTPESDKARQHKRKVSRAEEAMDDAMREAQRLTQLIIEEEARKEKERQTALSSSEDVSDSNTQGIVTPSSSQSDMARSGELEARRKSSTPSISKIGAASVSALAPAPASAPSNPSPPTKQFTSFDQILPAHGPTALSTEPSRLQPKPVLTLLDAKISLFDDSTPGDRTNIKFKPTVDYMIQIEPASSVFPGWMIARKYPDFETLHEVLRRISVITGTGFSETHPTLPLWRTNTKASLKDELERYLSDALHFQALAESEGMKRFLEKDQGLARSPGGSKGFGWPNPVAFDQMGKNMIDVLTKAPKEVAGGGQAILGGVKNVFSGKRTPSMSANRSSVAMAPAAILEDSYMGNIVYERKSQDSVRSVPPPLSRSASFKKATLSESKPRPSLSSRTSYGRPSGEVSRSSSIQLNSPIGLKEGKMELPPLPTDIPDDYASPKHVMEQPRKISEDMTYSVGSGDFVPQPLGKVINAGEKPPATPPRPSPETEKKPEKTSPKSRSKPPITEQETQVAVELLFAVITELYTLSSAWNIRRTLLNAAKTFLLRPGNPQLEAIRVLIQDTVIDSSTSDAGIAAQILKIRENSLPTEEELKKWPAPLGDKEKEELRIKARKLLVERGMPQALTSVMGAAASGEALGKVFDCLQVESVARGLMFGLMLQGLRAIVQ